MWVTRRRASSVSHETVWIARLSWASRGREVLAEQLQAAGAEIHQIVVYESRDVTSPDDQTADALAEGKIDWITVTSSAIARSIVAMFGNALHKSRLASISPVTSATLSELGFPPHAEATEYTTTGVIDAIKRIERIAIYPADGG